MGDDERSLEIKESIESLGSLVAVAYLVGGARWWGRFQVLNGEWLLAQLPQMRILSSGIGFMILIGIKAAVGTGAFLLIRYFIASKSEHALRGFDVAMYVLMVLGLVSLATLVWACGLISAERSQLRIEAIQYSAALMIASSVVLWGHGRWSRIPRLFKGAAAVIVASVLILDMHELGLAEGSDCLKNRFADKPLVSRVDKHGDGELRLLFDAGTWVYCVKFCDAVGTPVAPGEPAVPKTQIHKLNVPPNEVLIFESTKK